MAELSLLALVIPVYRNEENLGRLLEEMVRLNGAMPAPMEVVFVVDGSPDRSAAVLAERLPALPLRSRLVTLSRNFGSFAAIAAGMECADADAYAVLAADLQEPPELIAQFAAILRNDEADVVFGYRASRSDPWLSEFLASAFWRIYRALVIHDMPRGGIDVFACNRKVRDHLMELREVNTNLIALLFWLGFRRRFVGYHRTARQEGKSAWTLKKKLRYSIDSIFNFTDLPIRLLLYVGGVGIALAAGWAAVLLALWWQGRITVPGYTPVVLAVVFFGALTSFGLGVIGQYLWISLANARRRPRYVIDRQTAFRQG
jgi:glycosyltransferase involved in cell wall biosynthesis